MKRLLSAVLLVVALPVFGATTGQLIVIHPSAGSSTVLDLGDDGTDESTGLLEIATTGDTNSIATNPSADKLLIDFSIPWLSADVSNAGDNALNFFPSGAFEDARISQSSVTQHQAAITITESQVSDLSHTVDTDNQTAVEVPYSPTTTTDWTDPDPINVLEGLDDLASRVTIDESALTTHTGLPDAHFDHADTLTELNTQIGASLSDGPHTSFIPFSSITAGTSTTAAMVVGTGSSLKVSGTGTIDASGMDFDGDGTLDVRTSGGEVRFHPNDSAGPALILGSGPASTDQYLELVFSGGFPILRTGTGAAGMVLRSQGSNRPVNIDATSHVALRTGAGYATESYRCDSGDCTTYVNRGDSPSTVTCASSGDASPGFVVITPATSFYRVTQSDPDGCSVSLSETGTASGQSLEIHNVSNAGGTLDFTDSSGVQETGTGCSLSLWGVATFRYSGDRWILTSCITSN